MAGPRTIDPDGREQDTAFAFPGFGREFLTTTGLGRLLCRCFEPPELLTRVLLAGVRFEARILEIGSGAGKNLLDLHSMGFEKVCGVDPCLREAIRHDNGVRIHKCEAAAMEGEFDLILLHDVFEHLPQPDRMLRDCECLLAQGGVLLIWLRRTLQVPLFPIFGPALAAGLLALSLGLLTRALWPTLDGPALATLMASQILVYAICLSKLDAELWSLIRTEVSRRSRPPIVVE